MPRPQNPQGLKEGTLKSWGGREEVERRGAPNRGGLPQAPFSVVPSEGRNRNTSLLSFFLVFSNILLKIRI